ncbi:MAG TPA: hypothetical protein VIM37_03670 [Candidatus Microsaccharimonas sp.]|jgi:hypothetical protein
MATAEKLYFTSPDPNHFPLEGVRVAPNEGSFPTDAMVDVETDTHFLTFAIRPKNGVSREYAIALVDAIPPLAHGDLKDVYVENDVIKRDQEFRLRSKRTRLANQAFRALRIMSNIESL